MNAKRRLSSGRNRHRRALFAFLTVLQSCLIPCNLSAQFTAFIHYTPENGLPASEILDMNQDEDGYMWFASAFGLCRFDGKEFRTFTTEDGLPALSNTACFRSPQGRLWFGSYEALLCFTEQGQVHAFRDNEQVSAALLQAPLVNIAWINDTIMVVKSGKHPCNHILLNDNHIRLFGRDLFDGKNKADLCVMPCGHYLLWSLNPRLFRIRDQSGDMPPANRIPALPTYYFNFNEDLRIKMPGAEKDYMIKLVYCYSAPGKYYFGLQNRLFLLEQGNLRHLKSFDGHITRIFIDTSGKLWVSLADKGVMVFGQERPDHPDFHYLKGKTVSAVCQDHQGGYWFAVLGEGVYFVPGFSFSSYSHLDPIFEKPVEAMISFRDQLTISTIDPLTYVFTPDNSPTAASGKLRFTDIRDKVTDMTVAGDGSLWFLGTNALRYSKELKPMPLKEKHSPFAYQILTGPDHNIWVVSDQGMFRYHSDRFMGLHWSFPPGIHPRTAGIDSLGNLWIGTFKGLYRAGDSLEFYGVHHPLLRKRISCVAFTGRKMWIGSRSEGVLLSTAGRMSSFTTAAGLPSNSVNTVCPQGDSILWVGSNRGLCRILSGNDGKDFDIQSFAFWEGLPAAEIRKIVVLNERIWLGTNRGLFSFKPADLEKISISPPRLNIEKIILNDHVPVGLGKHDFKHSENTLEIYYRGISFKHNQDLVYRYRISDEDTAWIITSNPSIRLAGLDHGQYCFTIQAAIPGSAWSEPPVSWMFTIGKPFTATWWFILSLLLGVVLAISGIFLLLLRNQQRKENTRRALLISEIKALRAQMNPHFIFNALNSIQYFILENAHGNANLYLTNFARLIRRILEQSRHNLISLEDELITIRLYIELEKMRFEHAFEYVEQIDPGIDQADTRIPPMLLQPFLENSIWHGLSPRQSSGVLKLIIDLPDENSLRIIMEDNGVGRQAASKLGDRQPGHIPMGIRNVEERIALFNRVNRSDIRVMVIDLYDQSGQPAGTKVELLLTRRMMA
ncbi:MAG TPA: histidine kinase [Bacteroidales bacterium]|nr:histidine kinase [Bacteroidales bacterium]HSA44023.1 histidine kinase [Bacteroidales bacterium]